MSMQVDTTGVCSTCKHKNEDHVEWGGQPHYHGKETRDCSELHTYCMVPDCSCHGVVKTVPRQKAH